MSQVFISYSRVDAEFVALFIRRLQRAFPDLKIWHDQAPHGLIGGGNWWNDILAAIAASDVFIYILSNESVNSLYCQAEFTEARRLQKRIITVQARDRTELTDDLDDIQFIDMKEGVDAPEAIPSLVAALRLRLDESKKFRNARPLWKPATPKPQKEVLPTRPADAPDVETPPLEKPSAEQEALRLARSGVRWQIIGVIVSVVLGIAALALTVAQVLRDAPASDPTRMATQVLGTPSPPTQVADAPSPTQTESPSATPTPSITPTATDDLAATQAAEFQASLTALGVMQVQGVQTATADAATRAAASQLDATLRAAADTATANAIAITQAVLGETATQQSEEATRTREAEIAIANMTATTAAQVTLLALSWTPTPTPTFTPSPIPPTATTTPDPLQAALTAARSFTGSNADWQALYPDGLQYTFEDSVPMVLVPAGSFTIGANPQRDDEQNGGTITFNEPFWIDLTEVTQADFERLGGEAANASYFTGDQRPVEQITWFEARDFCALRGARLPTEAEWEYAARGPAEWDYPWGAAWNASNAVWNLSISQGTANVGSMATGRSWVGAFDLSGNVWEWTSSLYLPYDSTEDREADTGTRTDVLRVLRGGSWLSIDTGNLRAANRGWVVPDNRSISYGFRCARSS